ncbi:MAG: PhoH family protein [Lachnospiraceae bacterium]|nr:PhoH family protein [Lachnospiraceae bacterium]
MSSIENIVELSSSDIKEIFGEYDENVKKIERALHVSILSKENGIKIIGGEVEAARARKIINDLALLIHKGGSVNAQSVDYCISLVKAGETRQISELDDDVICHTVNGRPIKPKTFNQKSYVDSIRNNMIVFGLGPAGTGKTYLAMAMAIDAFKSGDVSRIILTRPAIEAGENLGFLPGDLQSKVDPYLRPLYDAIYQIMGAESYLSNSEKGLIEVAPLAYMRGRTLDNAFIILDEAQNTTPAQMKMFLTRIGFGSKVVITGDQSQKDLPAGQVSGLDVAVKVLENIREDIAICRLTNADVVRHPVVQQIVMAYEEYEKKQAERKQNRNRQ